MSIMCMYFRHYCPRCFGNPIGHLLHSDNGDGGCNGLHDEVRIVYLHIICELQYVYIMCLRMLYCMCGIISTMAILSGHKCSLLRAFNKMALKNFIGYPGRQKNHHKLFPHKNMYPTVKFFPNYRMFSLQQY